MLKSDVRTKPYRALSYALLLGLFSISAGVLTCFIYTGAAWTILDRATVSFWITVLAPINVVVCGIVFTYTLIHYNQLRTVRSLVTLLLAMDVIILTFFFMLTHPAMAASSPIPAERDRNRTIVVAIGISIAVTSLIGSFASDTRATHRQQALCLLWGALVVPPVSLWLYLSPTPVFRVTEPEGGLAGLTLVGWLAVGVIVGSLVSSLTRYGLAWVKSRERMTMASFFAVVLWTYAALILILLVDPFQTAELLWFGSVIGGFVILAVAITISALLEPSKAYEQAVRLRTSELEVARQESDFYLSVWSHKIGNLLQGIVTHLDLFAHAREAGEDLFVSQAQAAELASQAALINRQVARLSQVKARGDMQMQPVDLTKLVRNTFERAREVAVDTFPDATVTGPDGVYVDANELLEDMLFAGLSYVTRINRPRVDSSTTIAISVSPSDKTGRTVLTTAVPGDRIGPDIVGFVKSREPPNVATLDIDLFTFRLLLDRYHGALDYAHDPDRRMNVYTITFPKSQLLPP